jgi:hypothetical protein
VLIQRALAFQDPENIAARLAKRPKQCRTSIAAADMRNAKAGRTEVLKFLSGEVEYCPLHWIPIVTNKKIML